MEQKRKEEEKGSRKKKKRNSKIGGKRTEKKIRNDIYFFDGSLFSYQGCCGGWGERGWGEKQWKSYKAVKAVDCEQINRRRTGGRERERDQEEEGETQQRSSNK